MEGGAVPGVVEGRTRERNADLRAARLLVRCRGVLSSASVGWRWMPPNMLFGDYR